MRSNPAIDLVHAGQMRLKRSRLPVLPWMLLAGFILSGVAGCDSPEDVTSRVIPVGQTLPALTLSTTLGESAVLDAQPGKVMVLNVWGTWCAPCRRELPSLQRLANQLGEDGYEVVGVALDHDLHHVREYLNDRGITFRNYLDVDSSQTSGILGITAVPSTLFVDARGRVSKIVFGPREWDDAEIISELRMLSPAGGKVEGK